MTLAVPGTLPFPPPMPEKPPPIPGAPLPRLPGRPPPMPGRPPPMPGRPPRVSESPLMPAFPSAPCGDSTTFLSLFPVLGTTGFVFTSPVLGTTGSVFTSPVLGTTGSVFTSPVLGTTGFVFTSPDLGTTGSVSFLSFVPVLTSGEDPFPSFPLVSSGFRTWFSTGLFVCDPGMCGLIPDVARQDLNKRTIRTTMNSINIADNTYLR